MRILIYSLCLFFFGCIDVNKEVNDTIDSVSKNADIDMESDLLNIKKSFDSTYIIALNNCNSDRKEKLMNYKSVLIKTTNYIDSVSNDLSKYDNEDVRSNNLIKEKFIEAELGDSIYNKIRTTLNFAEEISKNKSIKDSIHQISKNALSDFNVKNWKNNFFSLNSPNGTMMVLYGFKYELFKTSIISLH